MSFAQTLHAGLADSAAWFLLAVGVWATVQGLRSRALGPSWFGAAIIAELLLLLQAGLGAYLYFFTPYAAVLTRPFMHILYGIVAVITLPSAWGYFSNIEKPQVVSLAMGLTCIFLWGIVQRSATTALYPFPGG